jgi:SAM-dependent methyltransferase
MPLIDHLVDTVCMVRVMHHIADVPSALSQIHRVIHPGGTFVLEFASKLHLKSILRYAFGLQEWSPYNPEPFEFVPLNVDFHPRWMKGQLRSHGFRTDRIRTVSHFRIPLLKQIIPARILAAIDGAFQWTGQLWQYTPSVFVRSRREGYMPGGDLPSAGKNRTTFFLCPACGHDHWQSAETEMHCLTCDARWQIDDGIYDLKAPL